MGCCIQVETIQSLLDEGRDVLTEILDASVIEEKEQCVGALTNMYRFRMIGSCDVERWVKAMTDRANLDSVRWNTVFSIYRGVMPTSDPSDLNDRVRTVSETEDVTMTDTTDTEREDIPETADAMDTKYLSERGLTDRDVIGKTDRTLTEKERNGMLYELVGRSMDAVRDPFAEWARRFDDLFLARW